MHVPSRLLGIFSALVVSGCVSADAPQATGTGPPASLITEEGAGALEGIVHDPSLAPLEGAQVGLVELQRVATTDPAGAFFFPNVPPGRYQLAAQKLGFESTARFVEVVEGATQRESLELVPLPVVEPYHSTLIKRGSFGCGFAYRPTQAGIVGASVCGALSLYLNLTAIDQFLLLWDLGGRYDEWQGNAFEMQWRPTQLSGSGLWVRFESDGCAGSLPSTFSSIRGRSPLREIHDATALEERKESNAASSCTSRQACAPAKCRLQSRVFPDAQTLGSSYPADAGMAIQQSFTQYWTQFFNEEPPEAFSAVTDT